MREKHSHFDTTPQAEATRRNTYRHAVVDRPYGESEALAQLTGAGMDFMAACNQLNIPLTLGKIYATSPVYMIRVGQIRKAASGEYLEQTEQILEAELPNNLAKLISLRDTSLNDNTALASTRAMIEMTPSMRRKVQVEELVKIVLQGEAINSMKEALATYKGTTVKAIDAEFFEVQKPD